MISFECDYNNGAHPQVLQHLIETNGRQSLTYGFDEWSEQARQSIREACDAPNADVFFLAGGTQTNMTVIDALLPAYGAAIAVKSGHISIHEAGAVEFTGHKVIELPAHDGKMQATDLKEYMEWFENDESRDHLAQPGLVYISFPTELGTVYTAAELDSIRQVCCQYGLKLFVDGARLGYGLMSEGCDVSLPFIAAHCDAFYIGGTKVGALCGEAVVFPQGAPRQFFTVVKQHGALAAKGRLMGLQFDALFTDNLYLRISRHAIDMAMKMRRLFSERGYRFFIDSPTNQQFFVIPNERVAELEKHVLFTHWEPAGTDAFVCRFVTSWATTDDDLKVLEALL
uniref:Low specificity L-threonine aldolase n=1 Tax=Prevotella sp. GTC17259 TaxID=3236795 RepID=A0AB33JEB0_9BACT